MNEMINTVSHKLYLLTKIRSYLTTKACTLMFKTIVLCFIEYRDIFYTGTSKGNLYKIVPRGLNLLD